MAIKIHTVVKGILWEAIGILLLGTILWIVTGDWAVARNIGIAWPLFRAATWPLYDWLWKKYARRFYVTIEVETQTDETKEQ